MAQDAIHAAHGTPLAPALAEQLDWFASHLESKHLSPRTIETYTDSVRRLAAFLAEDGRPVELDAIRPMDVEAFIIDQLRQHRPATAHNRFRGVQAFVNWAVGEGLVTASPMARMKPPKLPEAPPPVLTDDQLRRLLATCHHERAAKDRTFADVRDEALIRIFLDTGARLSEIVNLRYAPDNPDVHDLDLHLNRLRVTGKGNRQRDVPISGPTSVAVRRYLTKRPKHTHAASPWLWLGLKGRLTPSGVAQMVRERARAAGLGDHVHPHLFRHTAAAAMLADGMQETDLMAIAGWRSRAMVARYGAATRAERAIAAARKHSLGNRL